MKKHLIYIFAIACSAVSLLSSCTVDPELPVNTNDNGVEVIYISTARSLANIGRNSNYPSDGNYIMTGDIDLSDYGNWVPIGDESSNRFTGTFDGANYTISGLTIDSTEDYQGLFGYVYGGSISNVIVTNASITSTGSRVGGVVGYLDRGFMTSCSVKESYICGMNNVGGVIGEVYGYSTTDVDLGAYVYNANSTYCDIVGESYVGGVMGAIGGGASSDIAYSVRIRNCYNGFSTVTGGDYVGGVFGKSSINYGSSSMIEVSYCHNIGITNGAECTGGVSGYAVNTALSYCFNRGESTTGTYMTGGIVGEVLSSTVTACYNIGTINNTVNNYAGGVVGAYAASTISYCYNTAQINGYNCAAGVAGACINSSEDSLMEGCYNTGAIYSSYTSSIGAILGSSSSDSTIWRCYYIDHDDDNATAGVGSGSDSAYAVASVSSLNGYVSWMNGSNASYFTEGDPSDTNLPSLMGENLVYVGD